MGEEETGTFGIYVWSHNWFGAHSAFLLGLGTMRPPTGGWRSQVSTSMWHLIQCFRAKKKGKIQELTKRMADGSEDPKKWLPHYQMAKKIVKDGLTEEEISMFEEDVRVWQATGVPREIQAAWVTCSLRQSLWLTQFKIGFPPWEQNSPENGRTEMEKYWDESIRPWMSL